MAADVSFRMAFIAKGSRGKIDTEAIRQSLMAVLQLPIPAFLTSPWMALLVRIDVVAFLVSVIAASALVVNTAQCTGSFETVAGHAYAQLSRSAAVV